MKKKILISIISVIVVLTLIILISAFSVGAYFEGQIDYETDDKLFSNAGKSSSADFMCYDKDGNLAEFEKKYLGEKTTKYKLDEISNYIKLGFIAAEDRNFYTHHGIDIKRTSGAFLNYIFHIKPKFGASTITQQVIKNVSGDNEQSAKRKIMEIMRALHLERSRTKEEIFELYLNIVPMSENILGVGEAADIYFGKEPYELNLQESATLVGITNSPSRYNPRKNPDDCREKRNRVLYAMRECEYISEDDYIKAKESPLKLSNNIGRTKSESSWFVDTSIDEIVKDLMYKYGISKGAARIMLYGGTKVILTVNQQIQDILDSYFENNENFPKEAKNGLHYSMAIIDNDSGNLLAVSGDVGKKSGERSFNYSSAPVTPGSVMKPLAIYAPLLEKKKINWATIVEDKPFCYINGGNTPYPKNSPDRYDGKITLKDALRLSKNTVAVSLCDRMGLKNVFWNLKNIYGFSTLCEKRDGNNGKNFTDIALAPLALGQLTDGICLRKLTESYSAFPRDGVLVHGKTYYEVYDGAGNLILDNRKTEKRIYSSATARIMNKLLMTVVESGTARSVTLKNLVDTAGKTGTSGHDRDRLFIGYTPYVTAGIWCGYDDGKREIGSRHPSHIEIWDRIMKSIHEKVYLKDYSESIKTFSEKGLILKQYCKKSGKIANQNCFLEDPRNVEYGYFTKDNCPFEICDICEDSDNENDKFREDEELFPPYEQEYDKTIPRTKDNIPKRDSESENGEISQSQIDEIEDLPPDILKSREIENSNSDNSQSDEEGDKSNGESQNNVQNDE